MDTAEKNISNSFELNDTPNKIKLIITGHETKPILM